MDICNSRGTEVCKWAMTGQDNPRPSISTYPRQDKPAPHIWTTWRRLLRLTYSKTKECRLDRPLRKWYTGRLNQIWDTVINLTTALLYIWTTCKVQVVYEKQGRGHKRFRYLRPHHTASFPRRCVPISHLSGRILHLLQLCNNDSPPSHPPAQQTELQLMHQGVHTNIPHLIIAQAIWDGLAILGTDGSVKNETATYSWILSTTTDTINPDVIGGGLLPPPATYTDHYSKRPEAAALFAGLSWIYDLLKQ